MSIEKKRYPIYLVTLHNIIDPAHWACTVVRAPHRLRPQHLLQEARLTYRVAALEHHLTRLAQILDADGALVCLHRCFSQHW